MRSGVYAVFEGVEYEASLHPGGVSIYISDTRPRADGWKRGRRNTWGKALPLESVSNVFRVITTAMLDDIEVWVHQVDPVAETAIVRARHPPYSSINDQRKPPPHPLLEAAPNPPYSVDWMGIIPWDRLTDVKELSGPIDPATGEWLDSDAT